ncbi:hypothetical protein N7466_006298 [Penicillium verhagenii]|uniref:uncharacterized protein n=1 Tax=Penicillium verhagenii TaxID=1562060 RepID=UPI00254530B1|nr:uncharacterized protein N7466_006298 [Penicillium verhagenii]KAJ5930805.1 hypothetical protein N7466_006298 [Penicillium verhagenii]
MTSGTEIPTKTEYEQLVEQNDNGQILNETDTKELSKAVAKLGWLTSRTRPDLCYVVAVLRISSTYATTVSQKLTKHVLRYLKGNASFGLVFDANDMTGLVGSNFALTHHTQMRKSVEDFIFFYNGTHIIWKSRLQDIVPLLDVRRVRGARCGNETSSAFRSSVEADLTTR